MTDARRALPSVGTLLDGSAASELLSREPRTVVADAVRLAVSHARRNPESAPRSDTEWRAAIELAFASRRRRSLRPVINATGVVLHTNLGRAPLPRAALDAMVSVASGYSNLEYDLDEGERGSRYVHCVTLLRELTGVQDALVVNNGAAALVLALNTLAQGRGAVISRGELVEIGGSFRIPDVMARSGTRLVEVGTTNRTHAADYRDAIGDDTGVLVKVHRSNFSMHGFVSEVSVGEVAAIAVNAGLPSVTDLGSGLLIPLERFGLGGEPLVRDAVRSGATLVTMSGDKLLGGPQAGIILGTSEAVQRVRGNPLTRALRVDKLTLAALEATLALYRDPERAEREIPVLAMLAATPDSLHLRATALAERLSAHGIEVEVVATQASVGGGSFPDSALPSAAIALRGDVRSAERSLRAGDVPVVGRVQDGRLLLDLRSIPERDDPILCSAVIEVMA